MICPRGHSDPFGDGTTAGCAGCDDEGDSPDPWDLVTADLEDDR